MRKLTLWSAAGVGIGIFSVMMFSQAMSSTAGSAMARTPIVQNFSKTVGPGDNFIPETPGSGAATGSSTGSNILSDLLRVGKRSYNIKIDSSVSRQILSQYRVRKFGFGRLENVRIISTASGTYSSDALASPHIVYPGITISQVKPFEVSKTFSILVWQAPDGWKALESSSAPSFLRID